MARHARARGASADVISAGHRRQRRRLLTSARARFLVGVSIVASTAVVALTSTTAWTSSPTSNPDAVRPRPTPVGSGDLPTAAPLRSGTFMSVPAPAAIAAAGSRLVWSDEFDGATGAGPDARNWTAATGYGWGNGELQCYTSDSRNLALDGGGNLVITALREPSCDGAAYSSARIESRDKRTVQYGYVETRAVLPTATGSFPAVWMLGADLPAVGWPAAGEIDLVEAKSSQPRTVRTNVHGVGEQGEHWQAESGRGGMYDAGEDLSDTFHTYGVEWTDDMLRFYFDGELIRGVDRANVPVWLLDKPYYLLIDLAIAPEGASASADEYPQRMTIDYVRVYESRPE